MCVFYRHTTMPLPKIMAQLIKFKAHYPKHRIQSIQMDNAAEFSSRAFNNYCMALGIQVQHSVPYVHAQNGLVESLIKRIKLIARPLLMNCKLPTSCLGHAVLHTADLIQLRLTAYHETSPMQLVRGNPRVFPICVSLGALYTYPSHHLSEPRWVLTGNWGST